MGYKNVCLNCKRVENLGTDRDNFRTGKCPECSSEMIFVNHKFRPPKKSDKKGWELAEFLISHGFVFQRVRNKEGADISYPQTMSEAKKFVEEFDFRAIKN
ncbi:hypothetical protein [Reichenbachiella agariperforans]|uniref:hypothetical protein n=1 Tax=Reichenbachiella agariperforans TaxID=156994 RepID=UPI001C08FA6C|nr:hypothetical protein [Reichenbachiella agariperforans]MBU2914842.1 hypothetical protein [Reichenbachiella agariperforans]